MSADVSPARRRGLSANRRLLRVQRITHDPITGAAAFTAVNDPVHVDGRHAAALRFGDPRSQVLLATLPTFRLQPDGFTNHDLRTHLAGLLGTDPGTWPAGRATYDLRRLRLHGLILSIPHTHRYQITNAGLHHALFLTRVHGRLIRPGTAHLRPRPAQPITAPSRRPRLRHRARPHHQTGRTRSLKPSNPTETPSPINKLDLIMPASPDLAP